MTCIVGVAQGGRVWIGGDSAGVAGLDLVVRDDRKVFVNGRFAMGFTSSFRMGQLLAYALTPPRHHPDVDLMKFMVTDFINAVRSCLKDGGYAGKENDVERGGAFLVGYEGALFKVESDYQVGRSAMPFDACGCGESFARGALLSTGDMEPERRVLHALEVAEKCSAGVRRPFHVVTTQ